MLTAVLNNKAGRIIIGQGDVISWRDVFKNYEDLLTSAFFERFSYLDHCSQVKILAKCFDFNNILESLDLGELERVEYWPRFNLVNDQQKLVEPDVILNFKKVNILIEIKSPSGGKQYYEQWSRELKGILNSSFKNKPLFFLALGGVPKAGVNRQLKDLKNDFTVLKHTAAKNWHELVPVLKELASSTKLREKRIIDDMLAALGLYSVSIQDFKWEDLSLSSFNSMFLDHRCLSEVLSFDNKWRFSDFFNANLHSLSLSSISQGNQ
ncbi:hypothetical protein [Pseudoalteromonas sp. bablab_jr010]|uniref:hypothetical protein n=1 Tax=Pseudoalteromonas sp. bablab_jr010 TaxID=2755063 RepID=UPI0018F3493A|nr:hypothetical protein [Pseudoalteromonas sp. bablab_jr010]